jgi:hypothetical protein
MRSAFSGSNLVESSYYNILRNCHFITILTRLALQWFLSLNPSSPLVDVGKPSHNLGSMPIDISFLRLGSLALLLSLVPVHISLLGTGLLTFMPINIALFRLGRIPLVPVHVALIGAWLDFFSTPFWDSWVGDRCSNGLANNTRHDGDG